MQVSTSTEASKDQTQRLLRWHRRVLGFCLAIFALEVGLFLVVFPWLRTWEQSWIPLHVPSLAPLWMSSYFRGALTGFGLLDLYIAFAELMHQLRQSFGASQR